MVAATPHSMSWQAVEVVAFAVNCTAPSLIKTLAEARKQEAMGNMVCFLVGFPLHEPRELDPTNTN